MKFEIDSGSVVSTIKHSDAVSVGAKIVNTQRKVVGYSGANINLCGETSVKIISNNLEFRQKFLVVSYKSVNLLGRDFCSKLGIKITVPNKIMSVLGVMLKKNILQINVLPLN